MARNSHTRDDDAPLLSVEELRTHFPVGGGFFGAGSGVVKAVDGVSFDIPRGEVFGLVGESGSGKTTLGRSILNLVTPTSGRVMYQGQDLAPLSERQMRPYRRELSLIFQDPDASLNPAMTIGEGVGHPLRVHGLATGRADVRRQVCEMLERVGLHPAESFLDRYPEDLSGGQKQRLVIARALITKPRLVIADEPVAALDMSVRARVLELMLELKRELDLTYIFITHDLATARFMCDRIGILYLETSSNGATRRLCSMTRRTPTRAHCSMRSPCPKPDGVTARSTCRAARSPTRPARPPVAVSTRAARRLSRPAAGRDGT